MSRKSSQSPPWEKRSPPQESAPEVKNGDFLDATLRPNSWDEYVGQESIKNNLHILISAARERGHPPEHILFYGPPGLGKTTLAYLIAREQGANLRTTSGPAIERVGDLAALLTNLQPGDILFIDEIHRLGRQIEEVLYPAMESGVLNIIIGKGPSARTLELPLPPSPSLRPPRAWPTSLPHCARALAAACFAWSFILKKISKRSLKRSAKILGVRSTKRD
jgi:SpoVK/Ycf46/Vps4 family AAA+-type ATPase